MHRVRIYSSTPFDKTLEILAKEGFTSGAGRNGVLWKLPVKDKNEIFWDVYEWFSAAHERGQFLIHPEPVINPVKDGDSTEYREADNFSYMKAVKYHEATHELPNSIITTADENITKLFKNMPDGKKNPFLTAVNSLTNPIVFYNGETYKGSELENMRR